MATNTERQWHGKTGGGRLGQHLLLAMLQRLPARALYPALAAAVPFYLLCSPKSRNAIWHYFRHILHYPLPQALRAVAQNHFIFGKIVIDKFALAAGRSEQFHVLYPKDNPVPALLEQEKGFIMVGSHIGNFELLGHCIKQEKKKINCLIFGGENPELQRQREDTLAKNNIHLIPISENGDHLLALKAALENGEIVIVFGDRIFANEKSTTLTFLGKPAAFSTAIFRLARLFQVPLLAPFLIKEKSNRYSFHVSTLNPRQNESIKECMQQYLASIETILRQHPTQWFNYYSFWGK